LLIRLQYIYGPCVTTESQQLENLTHVQSQTVKKNYACFYCGINGHIKRTVENLLGIKETIVLKTMQFRTHIIKVLKVLMRHNLINKLGFQNEGNF
jgi:hypothetical protein